METVETNKTNLLKPSPVINELSQSVKKHKTTGIQILSKQKPRNPWSIYVI